MSFAGRMFYLHQWVSHVERVSSNKKADLRLSFFSAILVTILVTFIFSGEVFASDISAQKVIELANADREEKGLAKLDENEKLSNAALQKARDMVSNNYFAHTSPEGVTPWYWMEKEAYDYDFAGENLAMDFVTVEKMNQAWLASPTHRANILNDKYGDIGVAVQQGLINEKETTVVVQMFGSGDKSSAAERPAEKTKEELGSGIKENGDLPKLPLAENESEIPSGRTLLNAIITNPANGSLIAEKNTDIFGRAMPGAKITVLENKKIIGRAVSDANGWFNISTRDFSPGSHALEVSSEYLQDGTMRVNLSSQKFVFAVDGGKPDMKYQVYGNEGYESGGYLLKITSSKPNCTLDFGGEDIFIGENKSITLSVPAHWLSGMIKIEDTAGNKTYKEIAFANLSVMKKPENLLNRIAAAINGNEAPLSNLGKQVFQKNPGFAMLNYSQ